MAQDVQRQIFVNAGPIAHFASGDISTPLVGAEMHSDLQLYPAGMGFVVESGMFKHLQVQKKSCKSTVIPR